MATVGDQLTAPETGWKRYEDNVPQIQYIGSWSKNSSYDMISSEAGSKAKFKFVGTKLRILVYSHGNRSDMSISIDGGTPVTFKGYQGKSAVNTLAYEITGLALAEHTVEITNLGTNEYATIDAIDIDDTGYLVAPVGSQLTAPEPGWKRYDDMHPVFKYVGNWSKYSNSSYYAGGDTRTSSTSGYYQFRFMGTKLRIVTGMWNNSSWSDNIEINIDSSTYYFSQRGSVNNTQILVFEITGLTDDIHMVTIRNLGSGMFANDAIDIDDTGRLLHPDEVTDIKDLEVGKRIRFRYSAASGQFGSFYGLGAENGDFIPAASSATPNGDAYFIMVDTDRLGRKILVADRNIQHSISWDTLNKAGVASGSGLESQLLIDNLGVNSPVTITRSSGIKSNVGKASGKWYFEFAISSWSEYKRAYVGIGTSSTPTNEGYQSNTNAYGYRGDGVITRAGVQSSGYPTYDVGDIIGVQLDLDNGEMRYYKNGVLAVTISIPLGREYFIVAAFANSSGSVDISFNLGMKSFIYEVPQGFRAYNDSYSENMKFTIRLLTGGVSNTDKDNEWDKYIVNSDLNGTITPGDNNVWNWNGIASWTSTTPTNSASNRMRRGSSAVGNYYTDRATSYADSINGFRPVLIIERLTYSKHLFRDGSDMKVYDGATWSVVGQYPPTHEMFITYGMDDLSSLTPEAIDELGEIELHTWVYADESQKTLSYQAIPAPVLVKANSDISLTPVDNIDSVILSANMAGSGIVKVIVSADGGETWLTYNGLTWEAIDDTNLTEVKDRGISVGTFNTIPSVLWNQFLNGGKVRFAYYLEIDDVNDVAETDSLIAQMDMRGVWRKAIHGTDYDYEYPKNNTLRVMFFKNGAFKVNYGVPGVSGRNWGSF